MGWSTADIPNQQGRVALITGANSGLGLETARALKRCGATVVLACRSTRKADAAKRALLQERDGGAVDLLNLDLADLASVQHAANTIGERFGCLDLLINNAGVMAVINDEKLDSDDKLLTDDIAEDALNSMRFLPGEVTNAIETSLARVYDVDADELAELLFPED